MKKFKSLKKMENFEQAKLSKEQMFLANGGMRIIIIIRGGGTSSYSVCAADGDEPDCRL